MSYSFGTEYVFNTSGIGFSKSVELSSTETLVVCGSYCLVATKATDGSFSFGARFTHGMGSAFFDAILVDDNKVMIVGKFNSQEATIVEFDPVTKVLSKGLDYLLSSTQGFGYKLITRSSSSVALFTAVNSSPYTLYVRLLSVSGTVIIEEDVDTIDDVYILGLDAIEYSSSKIILLRQNNTTKDLYLQDVDVTNTTIELGAESIIHTIVGTETIAPYANNIITIDSGKFAVNYSLKSDGGTNYYLRSRIFTDISTGGTEITHPSIGPFFGVGVKTDTNRYQFSCLDFNNSQYGTSFGVTVSGLVPTYETSSVIFNTASSQYIGSSLLDSDVIITYADAGNSSYGTLVLGVDAGAYEFDSIVEYEWNYDVDVSRNYSFESIIEYELSYDIEIDSNYNFDSIIEYTVDFDSVLNEAISSFESEIGSYYWEYPGSFWGSLEFDSSIKYELDFDSTPQSVLNFNSIIEYGWDYDVTLQPVLNFDSIIDYELDYEVDFIEVVYKGKQLYATSVSNMSTSNSSKSTIETNNNSIIKIETSDDSKSTIETNYNSIIKTEQDINSSIL